MPKERAAKSPEAIVKVLFLSMTLGLGLALWGADPQAGVEHLMAAGKVAGEQVYSMLR